MFDVIRRQILKQIVVTLPQGYIEEIHSKLQTANIQFEIMNDKISIYSTDLTEVDKIISETILPNLLPAQFYWLLATTGLEQVIDTLLENLKQTDPQKYAIYQGFLKGARFYEFDKAIEMLTQAAPVITQAYPDLDLSIPTLKAIWLQAAKI